MKKGHYFLRRLLLIIPTFIGITLISFGICRILPGGPVNLALAQLKTGGLQGASESGGGAHTQASQVTESYRKLLEKQYGFDKPFLVAYWDWLWNQKLGMTAKSYKYSNKTVWELISQRFPVSLTFGLVSFVLTYLICIPLGIWKGLKNGTMFDMWSSLIVFALYAIPAFALGMLLKLWLCGTTDRSLDWFPASGFRSENWEELSFIEKIKDQASHMFLPVVCYVMGSFAMLTLLMKNSIMDQLGQDYLRTVLAKGGQLKDAVWRHAFRNALIPVATGIGGILSIMFAGSSLIEMVFNIPGIGLLGLDAITGYDYMVFMGIVSITSLVSLVGKILSDFCLVLVDPRIHFGKR